MSRGRDEQNKEIEFWMVPAPSCCKYCKFVSYSDWSAPGDSGTEAKCNYGAFSVGYRSDVPKNGRHKNCPFDKQSN